MVAPAAVSRDSRSRCAGVQRSGFDVSQSCCGAPLTRSGVASELASEDDETLRCSSSHETAGSVLCSCRVRCRAHVTSAAARTGSSSSSHPLAAA